MSCAHCSRRCKGRLCPDCELDERAEDAFEAEFDEDEKPEVLSDGGRQAQLQQQDPFGLVDLSVGDELRVTYESPRSEYDQLRTGTVTDIGTVDDEHGPTGSPAIVLSPPIQKDVTLWPAWDEIRTDTGRLGEITSVERLNRNSDQTLVADGGAIDNDFDDNELSAREQLLEAIAGIQTEPMAGGIAIDLVTRQPLFVRRVVADTVVEYYEAEGFDLLSYKTHPYLPVRLDDTVYECVYITGNPEQAHNTGNTYDFPRGRLMHCPVEEAWADEAGDAE